MESLRRGASGMDAARAVKGHGWSLRGDPSEQRWTEGSRAQRDPDVGGKTFWFLLGQLPKGTRPAGRNQCLSQLSLVGWVQPIELLRWASPILRLGTLLLC